MLKLNRFHFIRVGCGRKLSKKCNELSPQPSKGGPYYPAIQNLSLKARQQKDAEDWHVEISQVPTIEEKLLKINMPRYYGYKVVNFTDSKTPYNAMPVAQHYTRTVMEKIEPPNSGSIDNDKFDRIFKAARGETIEALEFSNDYCR